LAILVLIAVPAGSLVWIQTQTEDRLDELEPEPVALVIPVDERVDDSQTAVTVVGTWGEPTQVLAPDWFGTVTLVSIAEGSDVGSEDSIARIAGVDRIAWQSVEAFWRPLARRDTGDDVVELQTMLTALGFYEGKADGEFGRDLETSVKEWEASIGVVKPAGRFDPGYVVWLPSESILVASAELVEGAPAPGAGTVIVESAVPLEAVTLTNQEGRTVSPEGTWILQVGDVEVDIIDGVADPKGMAVLAGVLNQDDNQAAGRIRIAQPTTEITVPATAVVASQDGSLCVYVPADSGFVPQAVTVGSGRVSTVDIESGLVAGDEVLANPADVLDSPACQ
jgi:peptidoglycan hydrolase-like protein with peptidoglycan-binding domain